MTTKLIYTVPIPSDSQLTDTDRLSANLAKAGLLEGSGGGAVVESISQQAADKRLEGQYRGRYADLMATELEELANAGGIDAVALFGKDGRTPTDGDGYYTIESADVGPVAPQSSRAQRFDLGLTKNGTRNSHFRAITTSPIQVSNDLTSESSLTAFVGLDAAASKVRWFDPETGERASADPVATRAGEFDDIEIYDTTNTPLGTDAPTLLYDLAYEREGRADPVVWDTHNREKFDADGVNQWAHVFAPDHEFNGNAVFDTGLLRLSFDEASGEITAEEWDPPSEAWVALDLPATDWQVFDMDLTRIGTERIDAQVEFSHATEGFFSLDLTLSRGAMAALWVIPDGEEGPVPSGLSDHLQPIASDRIVDAQQASGLVSRSEVRR